MSANKVVDYVSNLMMCRAGLGYSFGVVVVGWLAYLAVGVIPQFMIFYPWMNQWMDDNYAYLTKLVFLGLPLLGFLLSLVVCKIPKVGKYLSVGVPVLTALPLIVVLVYSIYMSIVVRITKIDPAPKPRF